jgi:hypothetical protein
MITMAITDNIPTSFHPLSNELAEVLKKEGVEIQLFRLSRLIKLFENLKYGKFNLLSTVEKRKLLDNLIELKKQGNTKGITIVSDSIFYGTIKKPEISAVFPCSIMAALARALREERQEEIKVIVLNVFLNDEAQLLKLLSLDDIVFGFWSDDPLLRHRAISFMVKRYTPGIILSVIIKRIKSTGEKLPDSALKFLIGAGEHNNCFEKKKEILSSIMKASYLNDKNIENLWIEYTKGLNRYELIKVMEMNKDPSLWVEAIKEKGPQLFLHFKMSEANDSPPNAFQKRIHAIQMK